MAAELLFQLQAVESRVAAGCAWLDEHYPGWHNCIDLNTLDVADGDSCILGQVGLQPGVDGKASAWAEDNLMVEFSRYTVMANMHEMGFAQPANLAFCAPHGLDWANEPDNDLDFRAYMNKVQVVWVNTIKARRMLENHHATA